MEKQKKSLFGPMDLTEGTCWKTILIFSLPVILSYLLQQVYSISDAAIVGQTLDIPVIVGAPHATDIIRHGSTVTVDAQRGTVYSGVAKV